MTRNLARDMLGGMRRSDQIVITPTALGRWRHCPQQWRYRYEQRLGSSQEAGSLAIGILQHVALEALARGASPGEAGAAVSDAIQGRAWDVRPTEEQAREALGGALEVWRLVERLWPGAEVEEVEAEIYVDHPADPTIRLGGKPDILLRDRAGRRVLLDYKRRGYLKHSRPIQEVQPEDLYATAQTIRDVQSAIYAVALREQGRPVDESYLVKSTAGGSRVQIMRTTPPPEVLDLTLETIRGIAAQMRAPAQPCDRAYPAEGSCFNYGKPCEFSDLCAAEVLGRPTEDLRARLARR